MSFRRERSTVASFSGLAFAGNVMARRRADRRAGLAVDAFRAPPFLVRVGHGLRLAVRRAQPALDALVVVDPELEDVPAGEDSQERAERADIPAPEPLFPGVEGDDPGEDDSIDQEALPERVVEHQVLR